MSSSSSSSEEIPTKKKNTLIPELAKDLDSDDSSNSGPKERPINDYTSSDSSGDIEVEKSMQKAKINMLFAEYKRRKFFFWGSWICVTVVLAIVAITGAVGVLLSDKLLELVLSLAVLALGVLALFFWCSFMSISLHKGKHLILGEFDWNQDVEKIEIQNI